jgi:hypothetical protein
MSTKHKRLSILGVLLLLVIGAAVRLSFMDSAGAMVIEPVERIAVPAMPTTSTANNIKTTGEGLRLDRLSRSSADVGDANPFAPKSWYIPPPPPPPQKIAAPTAPPLPFTFVGKMEDENGNWTIYLAKGSIPFVLKKGDTFDNSYRLEDLRDGSLIIQYLPLKTDQVLPISAGL